MLEKDLQANVVKWVEGRGGESYKLQIVNQRGWTDETIFLPGGEILLPELKLPTRHKKYEQQKKVIARLQELGFPAAFCQTMDEVEALYHEHYGN